MADDPIDNHGTYGGYQKHIKYGIPPCDPCREARNAYMREFRKTNDQETAKEQKRIYERAKVILTQRHEKEFQRIMHQLRHGFIK